MWGRRAAGPAPGTRSCRFGGRSHDGGASTNEGRVAYVGAGQPRMGVFVVDANGPPRAMVGLVARGFESVGGIDKRLTDAEVAHGPARPGRTGFPR